MTSGRRGNEMGPAMPGNANVRTAWLGAAGLAAFLFGLALAFTRPADVDAYIVQGADLAATRQAVETVGGTVTHELGIIRAVGADLTAPQVKALRAMPGVRRVYVNSGVRTSTVNGPPLCADAAACS